MDFKREWTVFALEAEYEAHGMARIVKEHNAALAAARREGQEAMRERATQAIVSVRDEDLFEHSRGRVQDVLATIVSALPVVQDVLGRRLEGKG